jgi:transposase-like protein
MKLTSRSAANGATSSRAIDRDGNLVDSMLSKHRDMDAARTFFAQAKEVTGCTPQRVTTDGHDSYPRAIRRIQDIGTQSCTPDEPLLEQSDGTRPSRDQAALLPDERVWEFQRSIAVLPGL